jgi:iron complex transport system substrate-binding protein
MSRAARTLGALLAGLALATACAQQGQSPGRGVSTGSQAAFPVTIHAANGRVKIESRPQRVVSLSPTATEMLFALGAGDQVEAVDDNSNYPPQAPTTDLSGFEPNVEAIATFRPDLVVFSDDPGDLEASLDRLKIPALSQPAAVTLEDAYSQIEELGRATGNPAGASELVASMRTDIREIVDTVPRPDPALSYYYELDDTYFTATSRTFIGEVFALLRLRNIADPADDEGSGYPQLSAEYIVDADPDLIFLADTKCCGVSAETVAERPGWSRIAAVEQGAVVELDDDVASRWGPRVVQLLQAAAAEVREAVAG